MGRFLVHVDNGREKGIRALSALQKFQGVRKVRPDLPVVFILEKLRAGGYQRIDKACTVFPRSAPRLFNAALNEMVVAPLRLDDMEIVLAPAGVNVRVAGVLLLGALVVGFDGADGRPLVLFEP